MSVFRWILFWHIGLVSTFLHTLMSAEADALCGADYGQRSDERINSRNGYRHRDFDTRVGTLDVVIPKLRQGSYFPDWLRAVGVNVDGYREILGHRCPLRRPCRPGRSDRRDLAGRLLVEVSHALFDEPDGGDTEVVVAWGGTARLRGRVKTLLHSVCDQPEADSVHAQYDRVIDALESKLPKVADRLDRRRTDLLAFTSFPKQIWRQIWSDNP